MNEEPKYVERVIGFDSHPTLERAGYSADPGG
jgi:hypothetical protein